MNKKISFLIVSLAFAAIPFVSLAQETSIGSPITITAVGSTSSCPTFVRSLAVGSRGTDVSQLQSYLAAQGDFNGPVTGYFGVLTRAAVGSWQIKAGVVASSNIGLGIFGPLSRAMLANSCGTGSGPTGPLSFSASPSSGLSPLTVQFTAMAPQGTSIGSAVQFGDGTSGNLGVVPVCSNCRAEGIASHTYTSAGTYTATLLSNGCACPANGVCNCPNMQILGTATVTVTNATTPPSGNIQQLNAPGSVSLGVNGIAEIRNESMYFTLENVSATSATIQITPVGCWNSFPSDSPPQVYCMIAMVPIPLQTLSVGQSYSNQNYTVTLTQIANGIATFLVSATAAAQ